MSYREDYDEDELCCKIEGTTLDDEHHRTMRGALPDVDRRLLHKAGGEPDAIDYEGCDYEVCGERQDVSCQPQRDNVCWRGGRGGVDDEEDVDYFRDTNCRVND